jgi:4-alpha-glucanotransferase
VADAAGRAARVRELPLHGILRPGRQPTWISLERLREDRLLGRGDLGADLPRADGKVRFEEMRRFREPRLRKAAGEFFRQGRHEDLARFEAFGFDHAAWLPDYALWCALKARHGAVSWTEWPAELRGRDPQALARARQELAGEIRYHHFCQYEFARQWSGFRDQCRVLGIGLIGDVPIYVAHESADVWAHPELFHLDDAGRPALVAGVPPDYFSPTGQRWGHPLYRWDRLREDGYAWWVARLGRVLGMFDAVRLDHFIGFQHYWEIPASCPTAVEGRWVEGPGADLFDALQRELGSMPIIAEDLGVVTPEVITLRDRYDFPGMRVLQFAFGGDHSWNDHLPHRYPFSCVVYTGTHDNDTTRGWFRALGVRAEAGDADARRELAFLRRYLGGESTAIHWDMTRLAILSTADLAIIPAQDLLGIGPEGRMNLPSTPTGNWEWRMEEAALDDRIGARLRDLAETYGRVSPSATTSLTATARAAMTAETAAERAAAAIPTK